MKRSIAIGVATLYSSKICVNNWKVSGFSISSRIIFNFDCISSNSCVDGVANALFDCTLVASLFLRIISKIIVGIDAVTEGGFSLHEADFNKFWITGSELKRTNCSERCFKIDDIVDIAYKPFGPAHFDDKSRSCSSVTLNEKHSTLFRY